MPQPKESKLPDLHQRILPALRYLESWQTPYGAICDDTVPSFNVWETICGVMAIRAWAPKLDYDSGPLLIRALHFLFQTENSNGMLYHNDSDEFPDSYCLETSALYILMLLDLYPTRRPELTEKLAFVQQQQLSTGEWNIVNPSVPETLQRFPSVTAFALNALHAGGVSPAYQAQALDALLAAQEPDGHWGINWMVYGTPFYALSIVLQALANDREDRRVSQRVGYAKGYLQRSQQPDGRWFLHLDGFARQASAELQTALALQACLHAGLPPSSETVRRGIAWLLDQQRTDGSWHGGYFPTTSSFDVIKQEDVYATCLALLVLDQALP